MPAEENVEMNVFYQRMPVRDKLHRKLSEPWLPDTLRQAGKMEEGRA